MNWTNWRWKWREWTNRMGTNNLICILKQIDIWQCCNHTGVAMATPSLHSQFQFQFQPALLPNRHAKNRNTTRAPLMQISRRFRDRYANEQLPGAAWRHRRWITAKFSTMTCKFFQYANFFVGNMQICRSAAVSTARRVTFNWADNENPAANISSGFLPPRPSFAYYYANFQFSIFKFQQLIASLKSNRSSWMISIELISIRWLLATPPLSRLLPPPTGSSHRLLAPPTAGVSSPPGSPTIHSNQFNQLGWIYVNSVNLMDQIFWFFFRIIGQVDVVEVGQRICRPNPPERNAKKL